MGHRERTRTKCMGKVEEKDSLEVRTSAEWPEAKPSIWGSGAQTNTEPAQGKRVEMVVPRMKQTIPQGGKGHPKDASYRWGGGPQRETCRRSGQAREYWWQPRGPRKAEGMDC